MSGAPRRGLLLCVLACLVPRVGWPDPDSGADTLTPRLDDRNTQRAADLARQAQETQKEQTLQLSQLQQEQSERDSADVTSARAYKEALNRAQRIAKRDDGLILIGAGVGLGAVALSFAVLGSETNSSIKAGGYATAQGIIAANQRGQLYNDFGWAAAALASAAVISGMTLVLINSGSHNPRLTVAATPSLIGIAITEDL